MKLPIRIFIGVLVGSSIAAIVWFAGGRNYFEHYLEGSLMKPSLQFHVPARPAPVKAKVEYQDDALTVCNLDSSDWLDLDVRVNGRYVAEAGAIRQGECARMRIEDFHTADWKMLPAYKGLRVETVEVLAEISAIGYSKHNIAPKDSP